MVVYTAETLKTRALALADLQNSSFVGWGEHIHYMNAAYREVYQDMIQVGDTTYLKEYQLLTVKGTAGFALPDDFYQLASITDRWGNEIPRRRVEANYNEYGYELKENMLYVYSCMNGIILKYYPTPETITYKQSTVDLTIPFTPVSGWGTKVVSESGSVYDVVEKNQISTVSLSNITQLGKYSYIDTTNEYDFNGEVVNVFDYIPFLREDGTFTATITDSSHDKGVCTNDNAVGFYQDGAHLYYIDKEKTVEVELTGDLDSDIQRYIYWNGKHAVLTTGRIYYEDGSWETTDSNSVLCLLKADMETGYGYVVKHGSQYCLEGWTSNTKIDYPNNIFFDLVAYKLAIQYRIKQNADVQLLTSAYQDVRSTYISSISQDGANYTTIRNVDSKYARYNLY